MTVVVFTEDRLFINTKTEMLMISKNHFQFSNRTRIYFYTFDMWRIVFTETQKLQFQCDTDLFAKTWLKYIIFSKSEKTIVKIVQFDYQKC